MTYASPDQVEALLRRREVLPDPALLRDGVAGRRLLVTGAAGSIGSELVRQAAALGPRALVLLDQSESGLFRIDQEIRQARPGIDVSAIVGDIRDAGCVEDLFAGRSVDSVYHAAAYKHVPLMEHHVVEAVLNNVVGTWNLVESAGRRGVGSFTMLSTDKAVRPASVMGVTKRVAEQIVASRSNAGRRGRFMSVRFGNVLGSRGSVVRTFQAQIAAGGPLTVTDRRAERYFMSVREAARLVLWASSVASGGETVLLDMGAPVRILDLARRMICRAGFVPDDDIEIRITGLRPGEKLSEELMLASEEVTRLAPGGIRACHGPAPGWSEVRRAVDDLIDLCQRRDAAGALRYLGELVPEYRPSPSPARQRQVAWG